MKIKYIFLILFLLNLNLFSTPSTHIWSPSADVQQYKKFHLTSDFYASLKPNKNGNFSSPVINFGITYGILPFNKLQAEIGFDHISGYGELDKYPFYFNLKIALLENSFINLFPQLAFGMYGIGTKKNKTDYNILYCKLAKNISFLGKFSFGGYMGNKNLLIDENGKSDNIGFLIAYERIMEEISDKLWICIDYQSGKNSFGAFSCGFSFKFAENTSVIFGVNFYNNSQIKPTYTVQTDIDF